MLRKTPQSLNVYQTVPICDTPKIIDSATGHGHLIWSCPAKRFQQNKYVLISAFNRDLTQYHTSQKISNNLKESIENKFC